MQISKQSNLSQDAPWSVNPRQKCFPYTATFAVFSFPVICIFAASAEIFVYLLNMSPVIVNISEFIFVLLAELLLSCTALSAAVLALACTLYSSVNSWLVVV